MYGLSEHEKRKIDAWNKAHAAPGYDPQAIRVDDYGSYIVWNDYGNRSSDYGWEIDHIHPTVLGGLDANNNRRALHWKNNASLGGLLGGAR